MDQLDQEKANKHAVVIQSSFRGYRTRNAQLTAASGKQSPSDSVYVEDVQSDQQLDMNKQAVTIQSSYRGYKIRKQRAENDISSSRKPADDELNKKATVIQSTYRGYRVRKYRKEEQRKDADKQAKQIQSAYRGYKVRKSERAKKRTKTDDNKDLDKEAKVIQSAYRGYKVRKSERAKKRNKTAYKNGDEKTESAVVIQRTYRGYAARKKRYQKIESEKHQHATVIQSVYRGYSMRKNHPRYLNELADASKSQTEVKIFEESLEDDATVIQASVKGFVVRKSRREYEEKAIIIQSSYRGYQMRKKMALHDSATQIQGVAQGFKTREEFHKEKLDNENARVIQASVRAFNAEFGSESDMDDTHYSEEDKYSRKTTQVLSRTSKRNFNTRDPEIPSKQPGLGGRKFTEYVDHSSWLARRETKQTMSKEASELSSIPARVSRKENRRKPFYVLRSVTVSGDPFRGVGAIKTSKEIQVQDSDFLSRDDSKTSLSRKTTEVSFSDFDQPVKDSKKYRKTPRKLEGWTEDEEIGGRTNGKHVSSRHHSILNDVEEEAEEREPVDNIEVVERSNKPRPTPRKSKQEKPEISDNEVPVNPGAQSLPHLAQSFANNPDMMKGHVGSGYFNPFDASTNQPFPPQPGYQFSQPMMYPGFANPYGTPMWAIPMWGNPYQMGQPAPMPVNPEVQAEEKVEAEPDKQPGKRSGKDFLKNNKKNAFESGKKGKSYKELALGRKNTGELEEHGEEPNKKDEEQDLIQTHTTVQDDHRVKVDINLNISGRQLASMLGLDEKALSPRNQFYPPPPPMYPPMFPMFGNVSSRTMPEMPTNRSAVEGYTAKKKENKATHGKPDPQVAPPRKENAKKSQRLSPYPIVPPIKTDDKKPVPKQKTVAESEVPFAEKRKVDYKPHTLADYRKLNLDVKLPASLGPDWGEVDKLAEGKRRRAEYSEIVRRQHEHLPTSNKYPRRGESREMLTKPELYNEYIKTIPKPRLISDF